MKINTTYDEVQRRYPALVDNIVQAHRASRGKYRDTPPEQMTWTFDWCVEVNGVGLSEPSMTRDELMAYRLDGVHTRLTGSTKGAWRSCELPNPPEVLSQTTASVDREMAEHERLEKLTPEERAAEVGGLLRQLRGRPGFVELQTRGEVKK